MTIRRFHLLSVGKILGAIYAAISLLIVVPMLLVVIIIPMAGGAAMADDPDLQQFAGLFSAVGIVGALIGVLLIPIVYGAMGFLAGCLGALLYNLFARLTGGISFDVDAHETAVQTYSAPAPPVEA